MTTPARCVAVYRVPLTCEAAPHLGCGTRAKPALRAIEQQAGVLEAWLNREGTMLAVVWTDWSTCRSETRPLPTLLKRYGLGAAELEGGERREALAAFGFEGNWHRPSALDRLSEEEARVIAARMLARVRARIDLPDDQARRLETSISEACARILTDASTTSATMRRDQLATAILDAGRRVLGAANQPALAEAVALGHRPIRGEA